MHAGMLGDTCRRHGKISQGRLVAIRTNKIFPPRSPNAPFRAGGPRYDPWVMEINPTQDEHWVQLQ